MKKGISTLILAILCLGAIAQNSTDALRYSKMQYLGTARFNAMGGAFTALGGDPSAIVSNPAAVGLYRSSAFNFTPVLNLNQVETNYRGTTNDINTTNFNIGNISYIGNYKNDPNGWKYVSFAIGHNRISNFYADYKYKGTANAKYLGSSIIDGYVNEINNVKADINDVEDYAYPFGPSQAYWIYLIDPKSNNSYEQHVQNADQISQYESNYVMGKQAESYFSFGGNYQDRLYLGATIALQNVRYEREREYNETYKYQPPAAPIDSLAVGYKENTKQYTNGSGANIKLGAIYKINQQLRLGASIHSPTWLNFSEEYQFEASSKFSEGTSYQADKVISNYEYKIYTPWRYNAGLAYLIQNKAALSVDYEYVDYSKAKIKDSRSFPYDYSEENKAINTKLKSTHNLRFGAEILLNPFVIRGGFRYEDNPYDSKEIPDVDENRKTYSVGLGYRSQNYTIDLSYMQSDMKMSDPIYKSNNELANIKQSKSRIMLTLGWRW